MMLIGYTIHNRLAVLVTECIPNTITTTLTDSTLRNTLVFDVKSDKVHKDAIALANALIFYQVYKFHTCYVLDPISQ